MTVDRRIVEVPHPEHCHPGTLVFDQTSAGSVEKYARDECIRWCSLLNNLWVSAVELFYRCVWHTTASVPHAGSS